jgi:hypothetical protein
MSDTHSIASDAQTLSLMNKISELEHRLGVMEDVQDIRRLQHSYGYYIDKCLYDEATECFSKNAELKFLNGIWEGIEGVRRLYCDWFRNYFTGGVNGPAYGFLLDHFIAQDIVHVADDRLSAQGRFRSLMQGGTHESRDPVPGFPTANWEGGIYEHGYIKEDGVWKIHRFNYTMLWQADYHKGWDHDEVHLKPFEKLYPEDPLGPNRFAEAAKPVWPHTQVVPFHYPHPVTGEMWKPSEG